MRGKILVVDDDAAMCDLLETGLRRRGFDVSALTSAREALERVRREDYDVLVTDLNMPEMGGTQLCAEVAAARPGLPVVVITAFGDLDAAIKAIRSGAFDFISKPFELEVVDLALARAVGHRRMREEVRRLSEQVERARRFDDLVGASSAMRRVFDLLERVADSDATVLITGESGTGKELVAKTIHAQSGRAAGPFVAVNCAALPETLLESELFGHAKGAFTDARAGRQGLFKRADGGTLFLDEIGEMPAGMQAKLLRALQERLVRPVGGDEEVTFDARIVAATNRDLEAAVEEGRFRQDLFYRFDVVRLDLPPLRSRGSDALLLAQHLIDHSPVAASRGVKGLSAEAARAIADYAWPGNVRELQNCVERAVLLTRFDHVTPEDLPDRVRQYKPSHVVVAADDPAELVTLEEMERRYILKVLEAVGGQKTAAGRILGLDRKTLYRKLERWGSSDSSST
jgi:two-component system, NtrC family, response regulator AtoC